MKINLAQYKRDGFVILDVLNDNEVAAYRAAADELMTRPNYVGRQKFFYINFLLPEFELHGLHTAIHHPLLLDAVEQILGPKLVFDNASVLCADPGTVYTQGWHRDVLQVPQDKIDDAMFSDAWPHNNVQLNLALYEDRCFWAVQGSHNRVNSAAEQAAFGGTKHMSPIEAIMPEGKEIVLKPGQAALYNNNMIHRGYANPVGTPRRTLHIGYHSALHPPTFHFYGYNLAKLTPEFVASLGPKVREMVEAHVARRQAFPDVAASYERPTYTTP
jgi:ectoine hydroxylase-related dioxygenase (phytanoyl-CoA dioxygenase family)